VNVTVEEDEEYWTPLKITAHDVPDGSPVSVKVIMYAP
jgi:hypothetical protein